MRTFHGDEREEYDALINDCLNGDRIVNHDKVLRFKRGLEDAVQAHRPWARDLQDSAMIDGLRKILKARAKAESVILVDYRGNLIAKATRIGRRTKSTNGSTTHDQALITDFTWEQLEEWLYGIQSQIKSLLVNVDVANRLKELRKEYPETTTVNEALLLAGKSLNEYLGRAA